MSAARKAVALLLLSAIVVVVNDLAARIPVQVDLTRERFFTLSEASRRLVAGIRKPVQIELYFSGSLRRAPIGLKVFAQRVEHLLRQYQRASAGRVTLRVIDPVPGSRDDEEARRLGLVSRPLGPDERLYFGLAVLQGGRRRTIPLVDHRRERLLEYDVSRSIQAVQAGRLPRLAVVTSLEVFGKRGMPRELRKVEDGTAEWQFVRELRASYDVVEVLPARATLPPDADLLLVLHPSGLGPGLLHAIDQFVLSGRPAVILVDPYCYHEVARDEADGPVLGEVYHKSSDLPELFAAWGVRLAPGQVVADLDSPAEVPVEENGPAVRFPLWLGLSDLDDTQPVTAGLDAVLLAHSGALAPDGSGATTVTPLLRSSARSALLAAAGVGRMNPYGLADQVRPSGESYTLAATVEGRFRSAFPGGRPRGLSAGDAAEPDPWDLGLTASQGTSRVIVVADVDFLGDAMAYEVVGGAAGAWVTRPRNDNVALLANALDSLRGRRDLLPVRAKGRTIRPFTRVHDLRRAAEAAFRGEVEALNTRLARVEADLAALDRQAAQGGGSRVSQRALTAMRRLRKEHNGLRARRSAIEAGLQRSVSSLRWTLTVVNLGAGPLLVAVGGLALWLGRRRRGGRR